MLMHQVLIHKFKIFFILILLILCGCSSKVETISIGDWLLKISDEINIKDYSQSKPYFLNIDKSSTYYESVQALVEWDIIDRNTNIDPSLPLTREFVAYTLINLCNEDFKAARVLDSNKSFYPNHVEMAVALGLMQTDKKNCFNPKKIISKDEALTILDRVSTYIDIKEFENSYSNLDFNEDIKKLDQEVEYDENQKKLVIYDDISLEKDTLISFEDEGIEYVKKVEEVNDMEASTELKLLDVEVDEILNEGELSTSFEVDFTQAKLLDLDETNFLPFKLIEVSSILNKTLEIGDFKIKLNINKSGIDVRVNKGANSNVYASASLFNLKPTIKWKMDKGNIEDAYFRLDFKTNQALGYKRSYKPSPIKQDLNYDITNYLSNITSQYSKSKDVLEKILPLCSLVIPIPQSPIFTIKLSLQLEIYASGRVELSLSNDHSLGMEIKNNKIRPINKHTNKSDFIIKADSSLMLGINSSLNLSDISLVDASILGGIKSKVDNKIYFDDENGNIHTKDSDIPADFLEDLSDFKLKNCIKIRAHWALDCVLNSKRSLAGKLNLSKRISIFNEKNSPLFKPSPKILENFKVVDKCRYENKNFKNQRLRLNADSIKIKDYSIILNKDENKKIEVIGLPSGYMPSDLVFESENIGLVGVDNLGNIRGKKGGSTIIKISTNDNKYSIKCNILVKESK